MRLIAFTTLHLLLNSCSAMGGITLFLDPSPEPLARRIHSDETPEPSPHPINAAELIATFKSDMDDIILQKELKEKYLVSTRHLRRLVNYGFI